MNRVEEQGEGDGLEQPGGHGGNDGPGRGGAKARSTSESGDEGAVDGGVAPQAGGPSSGDEDGGDDGPGGGHLGAVVSTERSPTFGRVEFRLDHGWNVRPGKFVAVRAESEDGDRLVLARVLDVHEVNPHEDPHSSTLRAVVPFETKYAGEGASTVIYRLAFAEPLEEAVIGDGGVESVRSVETLPRAGAPVLEAGADLTVAALGLEPDPDAGIHIGAVYGQPDIPVVLARDAPQRHIFIGGGVGSGKSYTRGVIGEELHRWGVPQVNVDVNGEMIQAAGELGGQTLAPQRGGGFTIPLSALTSRDVLEAVPSINPSTNMATLLTFAHESLLREVMERRRDFFGVDDLIDEMGHAAVTLGLQRDSRTVEPAKLRTRSLSRLPFIGAPFDWRSALAPGGFINIDCRSLLLPELRLVTAAIARDLQRLARRQQIPFTVFSVDEFHLVAPNGEDTIASQVLREIARIGRHHRLGLILTTQSPSDVDRSILKRCLTRFLHAIEPDQLDALRGVFSDASQELVRMMPKLPQGTCVLTGVAETVRHATVVEVRRRITTHGGQTPDIWPDLAARGWPGKRELRVNREAPE